MTLVRVRTIFICLALLTSGATPAPPADPADLAFASGDFASAAAAYREQLEATPGDSHAALRLGELALYENDLDDAERFLSTIPPASPDASAAARELAEVARRRSELAQPATVEHGETSVPLVAVDPLPAVRVSVDGTNAIFLIDTGAPGIVLDPDFARRLHLTVTSAGTGVFAGGRTAAIQRTVVPDFRIGGAETHNVSATLLPTHAAQFFPNVRIDGIVGTGLFERFLATIDYPHARLVLRARSAAISSAFERSAVGSGATVVRCWLVGDHFVFARARVDDAPEGLFLFDSGLAGGGIMPSASLVTAAHLALDTAHAGSGMGGAGSVQFVPFVAPLVAVGSAVQRNVPGSYTPQGTPFGIFPFAVQGAISHLFLKHYAYTVDFTAMRIVLQPEP